MSKQLCFDTSRIATTYQENLTLSAARALAVSAMLGMSACSTTPRPPPQFHVAVTYSARTHTESSQPPIAVGQFEDARDLPDRSRIGEIHAPGYNTAPLPGARDAAAIAGSLQLLYLANPRPTGWWVYVKGAEGIAPPIERAFGEALRRAGHLVAETAPLRVEATIRTFWLTPSWTTRCDTEVAVKLVDENGALVWTKVIAAHAARFVGLFDDEAFENVVRMTMDTLIERAATEFASLEFAKAVTRTSSGR